MNILIGCDPEVFALKEGQLVSAYGMIEGNKENPFKVDCGAVQVDGMALEFNTDPAATREEFIHNVSRVKEQLAALVPDHELSFIPTAFFGTDFIKDQPEAARELGCDPDYNAWTGKVNVKPDGDLPFRTGAGHIHIGWTQDADIEDPMHIQACETLVKQLDFYLGIPSVLFDTDVHRRTMYGAAGSYRPKSYGVEYRTLSNKWAESEELTGWVYDNTMLAVNGLMNGRRIDADDLSEGMSSINRSSADKARLYMKHCHIPAAPEV